ncbi:hypothetical protein SUNI508_10148 [Seiridium unicorne]|uniref:Uncharacterized protein n=1 Tax=Seiridium unicorne TaxID=138068 RepID=A0ABR2UMI5_9PEZI
MAPSLIASILARQGSDVASQVRTQWAAPSDIMSLLLLVGADVVKGALAQQTGGSNWLPPPVVFSFGWVAYSFSGILAAVGDKTFLPSPEFPAVVMSTEWGYHRVNNSWIISRLLRDYEELWMPMEVKDRLNKILAEAGSRRRLGLCVSVFEASPDAVAGVPARDILWYSAVPWAAYGIWEEFIVTALGTVLAFFTASLPHWTHERWACKRNSRKTFVLTRGNGAQHAIVVIGAGRSLDLEDLATSSEGLPSQKITPIIYAILTVLWRKKLANTPDKYPVLAGHISCRKQETWLDAAQFEDKILGAIVRYPSKLTNEYLPDSPLRYNKTDRVEGSFADFLHDNARIKSHAASAALESLVGFKWQGSKEETVHIERICCVTGAL